jgi:NTE family protein
MAYPKDEKAPGPEQAISQPADNHPAESASVSIDDPARAIAPEQTLKHTEKRPTVALTLGSGGARGYAHIGAIEVLVERGYDIVAISGCSMGALIGGVYAAGKMQDYKDWVTGLGQFDILKLLDVTFNAIGAIRGEKIFSVVREMLGDIRIENLPIAYTAVATDLLAHKEVWFQEGPLDQAIRASVAIPSVVTPLVLNGRVLVDGALLNPLPIVPTISSHADIMMAVNLSGEADQRRRIPDAAFTTSPDNAEVWVDTVREKASHWFDWDTIKAFAGHKQDSNSNESPEDKLSREMKSKKDLQHEATVHAAKKHQEDHETINWDKLGIGKFDVMNLTIETMQSALVQYKIAGYPPDLLIDIPKNSCRSYDYHKAPELIQLGRECMSAALDRFEENRGYSSRDKNL